MAEEVYGFCKSKCKHKIFTQADFAVVSGKCSTVDDYGSGTAYGSTAVNYPDGFHWQNCFVIGVKANTTPGSAGSKYETGYGTSHFGTGNFTAILDNPMVYLNSSNIEIEFTTSGATANNEFEILLMKYDD